MAVARRQVALACVMAALVALLAGCARYYWSKPGGLAGQFDQDHIECARETSANPTEAAHCIVNMNRYRACLEARKWVRTKEFDRPASTFFRGCE